MAKFSTISKAASAAILGAVLLTGCGSSTDSATTDTVTSISVADGYVGGNGRVIVDGLNEKSASANSKIKGSMKLTGVKAGGTIKIKGGSGFFIDAGDNNGSSTPNGIFDGSDVNITWDMESPSSSKMNSHLTTQGLAMDQDLNSTKDFLELATVMDPVAALNDANVSESVKKMMAVADSIKVMLKKGQDLNELNVTAVTDDTVDLATLDFDALVSGVNDPAIKAVAKQKAQAAKAVVEIIETMKDNNVTGIDFGNLFTRISDGGENNITAAIESSLSADTNLSAIDLTSVSAAITAADANLTAATAAEDNLPATLILAGNTVTFGKTGEEINVAILDDNTFETLSISATDDNLTIENLACVTYPGLSITKKESDEMYDLNLSIAIKSGDQELTLSVTNAKIEVDANSTKPSIELIAGTSTLKIAQSNILSLQNTVGYSTEFTLDNTMALEDNTFNINTIIENVASSTNQDKINTVLTNINSYLTESKSYDVTLGLSTSAYTTIGALSDDNVTREITGTINVNMDAETIAALEAAKLAAEILVNTNSVDSLIEYINMEVNESLVVTDSIYLPHSMNDITVAWTSTNTNVDVASGSVTQTVGTTQTATLTATVTAGSGDAEVSKEVVKNINIAAGLLTYDNTVEGSIATSSLVTLTGTDNSIKFNTVSSIGTPVTLGIIVNGTGEAAITIGDDMTGAFVYTTAAGVSYTGDFADAISAGAVNLDD